jgi:hypothetical protein
MLLNFRDRTLKRTDREAIELLVVCMYKTVFEILFVHLSIVNGEST